MDHTASHPTELTATLERMGLGDVLDGFVAPERVRRWGFLDVERFAAKYGYEFRREHGNLYGQLHLVPIPATVQAPVMRLVTRSDVAAVHGSRRRGGYRNLHQQR